MPKSRSSGRITLADVARESGFSSSTVSIVLNEAPLSRYVAAGTKLLIKDVSRRLGYRPDALARSLRGQRSRTVGIMVFDISDPFCTLILRGIQKTLEPTSYLPLIMDAHNEPKQFERYLELLLERRLEALILIANWLFVDLAMLGDLEREQIPMVMVGRAMPLSSMGSVMVDNEAGGYKAIEYLHSLGHTEIAVIRGPLQLADSSKRWKGMKRYARKAGLKLAPELVLELSIDPASDVQAEHGAADPVAGFHKGYQLTRRLIRSGERFTAIIAFDDMTAFGVLRALREADIAVPAQCSVIGFDDVPHAALSNPALTTIRQPMEAMGRMATEWVLRGIDEHGKKAATPAEHALTEPAVVVRESTGVCPDLSAGKKPKKSTSLKSR